MVKVKSVIPAKLVLAKAESGYPEDTVVVDSRLKIAGMTP
jgi:hypothetical protein